MHRIPPRPLIFALPLLGVVFSFSCTPPEMETHPPVNFATAAFDSIPACPLFVLRDTVFVINVTPAGGTHDLGGGSEIQFPEGAVERSGSYTVRVLTKSTADPTRVAGIRIDSVNGAPIEFNEPVRLRISYLECPFANTPRRLQITRRSPPGPPVAIGGAKSAVRRYVEVLLDHFTDYAIAM